MKKILVIGAGAMGGFYSGLLAQAGAQVTLLCRSDYEVVKERGIFVKSYWRDFHFMPHAVIKNIADYRDEADFILVATKVLPNIDIASLIAPALSQNSSIVLLQNGIHIEKPIAKKFPNHHLISVLAFTCLSRLQSGEIHHQEFGRLIVGDFPRNISSKTQELIELWKAAGVPVEASENICLERWKKLVWNAAFNPMSVLCNGANTAEILKNSAAKNLAQNVMSEVALLAKVDGCELQGDIVEKNIEMTEKMRPYKTSMLLDFEAKREMEIEAILGNALRFAEEKNIETPYLSSFYALLSCY